MKITDVSIDQRTSVFIITIILALLGFSAYMNLPRESAPDISIPLVIVTAQYPGVSPEDIESLVTQPIEKEINSIKEVKEIYSSSFEGSAIIRVEFESGFDIDEALRKVREKVDKAQPKLPPEVEKPQIFEINFSEFPIMTINISGQIGLSKLKDIAEDLKDEIEKVNGVLEAKISGGLEREVKVNVDGDKLTYYNVRFDDISSAIRNENKTIPGGSIDVNNSSFSIRIPGEFTKPYIIEDIIVKVVNGKPIYVRDLASVEYSFKDPTSFSRLNGIQTVTINVSKRTGANIIDVADKIKKILNEKRKELPESIDIKVAVDFSNDIKNSVKNLENNIVSGLILVTFVLLFFLGLRNALLVGIAIPLSMLISFLIMSAMGITLNFVVLFSLVLALGMLVDNAIVAIENIYKFLEEGNDLITAAKKGVAEIAWPITTSTLTTLFAFGPLLLWPGVTGDFMSFLPITVIITLSSSLLVALTINPALGSRFMKLEDLHQKKSGFFGKLYYYINRLTYFSNNIVLPKILNIYEKILRKAIYPAINKNKTLHWRNAIAIILIFVWLFATIIMIAVESIPNILALIVSTLSGIGIMFIFANNRLRIVSSSFLILVLIILVYREFDHGVEFFPTTDPNRITINVEAPTGTNIYATNKLAEEIERRIEQLNLKNVKFYNANVGISNNPFDAGAAPSNKATVTVQFIDFNERDESSLETTEKIRNSLNNFAGADINIEKQTLGPPVGKPINIEISGDDLKVLSKIADEVKKKISEIEGVVDIKSDYDAGKPEMKIIINREKAALYGMNTSLVGNFLRTAINGVSVSKYRIGEDEYDITVRLRQEQRNALDALNSINIIYNDQKGNTLSVPLSAIASIEKSSSPGSIKRKGMKRVITISANVAEGYNANEALKKVKAALNNLELPSKYEISFTGQNKEQAEAAQFLSKAFLIVIALIFITLVIQFNSLFQPLIIMFAVLISLVGIFMGLTAFALPFGIIMSGIAIISLAGVVVNNNIVLIDYYNILKKRGIEKEEAAVQAGIRRFRPVTLTAITTILGLIPLTFNFGFDIYSFKIVSGGPESAFWRSMGVSVIFGLSFGTILTLIIVPTIVALAEDAPIVLKNTIKSLFKRKNL